MARRVQSPSSIKTYKQCPRKYYYTYIEKRPTPPNIHQVRGNIAHSVLENFFDVDVSKLELDDYKAKLKITIQRLLVDMWKSYKNKMDEVGITKEEEIFYFEETCMMLLNWAEHFFKKVDSQEGTFQERFKRLTPEREQEYKSIEHEVRGFIDAIERTEEGIIRLMDYKTDKKSMIDKHTLQLAIYALLYQEKHGELPTHLGVYFLRDREYTIEFDPKLVEMAKKEIAEIHKMTETDDIEDYPRCVSPLCKWRTGQCEHYDVCKPHG